MKSNNKKNYAPLARLVKKTHAFILKVQHLFYVPPQIWRVENIGGFEKAKAEFIFNYTNNVIKLESGSEVYYFKEARVRCNLKEYVNARISEFFTVICPDPVLEREITQSLSVKKNLKKLVNMGDKTDNYSPFNAYLTLNDERLLGLPQIPEDKKGTARKFIFYIYGELTNYFYNFGVKKGKIQTFLAARAVAVKKLADMLSVGYIVPQTRFVKILFDGCERYGVLENRAEGIDASCMPCDKRRELITPQLLREFTILNVLDALCHDDDHRVNNYHAVTDGGKFVGVTSFDNDGPSVFFPSPSVNLRHSTGCSRLINRRGLINRPHMDRALAGSVLNLKRNTLKSFCNYLNPLQRNCLWSRIRKLQKALLKTSKKNPDFLLDKDEWTAAHIQEDLSGRYGKTYLASFLTDCYYPEGVHPFDMC